MAYSPRKSRPQPDRGLVARAQVLLRIESEATEHELVEGIKKFWRKKVTPEKCGKCIDHVLHKAIPAVVEAEGAATKY